MAIGIDANTKLLIHFNGADGSTDDYTAETGQTIAFEGTAQLDTAQKKFGTASLLIPNIVGYQPDAHYKMNDNTTNTTVVDDGTFDNDGTLVGATHTDDISTTGKIDRYLKFDGSTQYITANALAVELDGENDAKGAICFWVYKDDTGNDNILSVSHNLAGTNPGKLKIYTEYVGGSQTELRIYMTNSAGQASLCYEQENSIPAATWTHIALVQDGTELKLYRNGVLRTLTWEVTNGGKAIWFSGMGVLTRATIGADWDSGVAQVYEAFLDGGVDDLRIYGDFAGSQPYLLPAQVLEIYNSGNGTEYQSNSYCTVPDSDDWDFDSGVFTIDFWVYTPAFHNIRTVVAQYVDDNNRWELDIGTDGSVLLTENTAGVSKDCYTNAALPVNTWTHVAIVKGGTGANKIYYNGVSQTIASDVIESVDFPALASALNIGTMDGTNRMFNGQIDELRISKGIQRWTADFTPAVYEYGTYLELSSQALTLTQQAPLLISEYPAGNLATALTLNSPSYKVTALPDAFTLTLTTLGITGLVTMFPDCQSLALTMGIATATGIEQIYDPVVSRGCPQCGTLLYPGKEIFSEEIRYGQHADDDDDEYVRCARCGFPCRVSRTHAGSEGGREGWGMTYTLYDRTTGL